MAVGVEDWIKSQTVLISGGSGFLGKALIYKLLKCGCSQIYVLMRGKKNMSGEERLDALINHEIFDKLRQSDPLLRSKIHAIDSSMTEIGLGLSEQDRITLQEEVTAVFHVAASVKFDDPLKYAVFTNIRCTREMIELAKGIKHLQVFQHVSTAYCNLHHMKDESGTKEQLYEKTMDWEKLIKACETLPDEVINTLEKQLLKDFPNTYLFTKNIAEHTASEAASSIPIIITRPAFVTPAVKEPDPGWFDNLSSPVAMVVGSGKGVLRVVSFGNIAKTFTPVDIVTNACICASWKRAISERDQQTFDGIAPIYNIPGQLTTPLEVNDICHENMDKVGMRSALWYPNTVLAQSPSLFLILHVILHFIPGLFFDSILLIAGQKPRLCHIYRKIYVTLSSLSAAAKNVALDKFDTTQMDQLIKSVPVNEQKIFPMTNYMTKEEQLQNIILTSRHVRKFFKEPPLCKGDVQHLNRLWWLDRAFKVSIILLTLRLFPYGATLSLVSSAVGFIISIFYHFE